MINNTIHIIEFTPIKYATPVLLQRNYLLTENNEILTTELGEKIRL